MISEDWSGTWVEVAGGGRPNVLERHEAGVLDAAGIAFVLQQPASSACQRWPAASHKKGIGFRREIIYPQAGFQRLLPST
jgi:hypothetical protein